MSLASVRVRGDGIAAWCCARLLSNSGFAVSIERPPARKRPWILVSDPAQRLLSDIAGDPDLFQNTPRIRNRTVRWGPRAEPVELEHSSAIVEEQEFLARLWPSIPETNGAADWSIIAAPPVPTEQHHFGSRTAFVCDVDLNDAREACWVESFEHGWLFLVAGTDTIGSLIAVGARPEVLLESSRSVGRHVSAIREVQPEIAAYPRIASPMFGDGWLACGTAAMMLDPLCGDGCGHAVREAILAAAVLRGGGAAGLLDHYQSRLRLAFERHLSLCRNYYVSGCSGPWWEHEISHLDRGLAWSRANAVKEWRYRLQGFDLITL